MIRDDVVPHKHANQGGRSESIIMSFSVCQRVLTIPAHSLDLTPFCACYSDNAEDDTCAKRVVDYRWVELNKRCTRSRCHDVTLRRLRCVFVHDDAACWRSDVVINIAVCVPDGRRCTDIYADYTSRRARRINDRLQGSSLNEDDDPSPQEHVVCLLSCRHV